MLRSALFLRNALSLLMVAGLLLSVVDTVVATQPGPAVPDAFLSEPLRLPSYRPGGVVQRSAGSQTLHTPVFLPDPQIRAWSDPSAGVELEEGPDRALAQADEDPWTDLATGVETAGTINTLRVYGRGDMDAAFPYASDNYTGSLALTNAEAPPKDFVQFNPAIMRHNDDNSLGQFGTYFGNAIRAEGDASEKVHLRMWYVPEYEEPRGLTYPEVDPVLNPEGDIVLEYTYILLDPDTLDPRTGAPQSTRMVFPMAGLGGQNGLDRMDVNGDGIPEALSIDEIVGVVSGTLGSHQVITYTDGISNDQKTTRGIIKVSPQGVQAPISVPANGQVQFLDYMARLEGVSLSGAWADVSVWYIGNATESLLGVVRLDLDEAALAGRFWGPSVAEFPDEAQAQAAAEAAMVATGLPARPFWVTLDSIYQNGGTIYARLTPHRLLMPGETFFVDCVEYDVAAILVEDVVLNDDDVAAELKYITLRNPLPKGDESLWHPDLTVEKCQMPAEESLWMLPPFNYQHDMVDDVNIPEKPNPLGPDDQWIDNVGDGFVDTWIVDDYDLIAERVVEDVQSLDGDLFIGWISEAKEKRFDTNLLEEKFIQEQVGDAWDEEWQWINIETQPWHYTEFILPALPDKPTQVGYTTGDYVLVSSFLTEDSITTTLGAGAVRLKFAYDANRDPVNDADIYVNSICQNTLKVYGRGDRDAAFPYASDNYTGPFDLTNAEAPPKDFVQFNPALMRHNDDRSLGQFGTYFGNAIRAEGDASEKVHLRMWYVPEYAEPRGLTYPDVDPVLNPEGDIVLEYTYILLDPDTLDPRTGPPQSTRMVFPMAGLDGQNGLDRMDVNGDGIPEALSIDRIVGVVSGTLGSHQVITYTEGITDNEKTTRGIIEVSPRGVQAPISVPANGRVQFLDYMLRLEGVSLSGEWAEVSVWYIGNATESLLGVVRLALDEAALAGRFWGPAVVRFADEAQAQAAAEAVMVETGLPTRPFWVTLDSIYQNGSTIYARLTPHRLLMPGETFFVDCVEYDVAAILVEDVDLRAGEVAAKLKYITLRNPLPKGEGTLWHPNLTVEKCRMPAGESLWILPPFNYQHDMVDDVNIPEKWDVFDPDEQKVDNDESVETDIVDDYDLIAERVVEDVQSLDGDLLIGWLTEAKEKRFDTNLLEEKFIQEQVGDAWDEEWRWINIETLPWHYTEFVLPVLPDRPTEVGYTSGDYVLVSSFLTEDSISTTLGAGAVRLKFAYDAADGTAIYVDPRPGSQGGAFRGRVKLESAGYQALAPAVQVIENGSVIADQTVPTDASGYFTLTLDPGTYDVWVKEMHALARRTDGVVINTDATTACDFGALLVGDAGDDNLVDLRDYGVWRSTLRSTTDLRADFNLDGQVTSLDFGWIKQNFVQQGDDPLTGPPSVSCAGAKTSSPLALSQADPVTISLDPATNSVTSSEVFTVAITVAAGDAAVDSADVFVDFDPTYLEVRDITGSGVLDESGRAWDNGLGELFYGVADLNRSASGTFALATITFKAKSAPVPETRLTFGIAPPRRTTVNSGVTPLPLAMQPATVEIRGIVVSIQPPSSSVCLTDVFTLAVQIEAGAQELDSAQAFVDFNPTYLQVMEIRNGGVITQEIYSSFDNASGYADYAAATPISTAVSGTFTLANIIFHAVTITAGTPATVSLHATPPRQTLVMLDGAELSRTLSGSEVAIEWCYQVYLPILLNRPPYTISGRVIDENTDPVSGVTVSSHAGDTAITGSDGNYRLSGLLTGTYTIAPSSTLYTFVPVSRTVSVLTNVVGINFTATLPCEEAIANGGFEADSAWQTLPGVHRAAYTSGVTHSGNRAMRIGIMDATANQESTSSAYQTVTLPADATRADLAVWLYPASREYQNRASLSFPAHLLTPLIEGLLRLNDAQYVRVLDQGGQWLKTLLWQRSNDQAWTLHQFDLLEFAGRTITLEFVVYNDGSGNSTGMYLDDVSLQTCRSPASTRSH